MAQAGRRPSAASSPSSRPTSTASPSSTCHGSPEARNTGGRAGGLEGVFQSGDAGLQPQTGTVAGPHIERGQTGDMPHPDHTALAYMDDVATGHAPPAFSGAWQSQVEPAARLDLHQLRVSPGTRLFSARAAQAMGTPETSNYLYHPVLWRRTPQDDTTCVDLVFEPRIGEPALAEAVTIPSAVSRCRGRQVDHPAGQGDRPLLGA